MRIESLFSALGQFHTPSQAELHSRTEATAGIVFSSVMVQLRNLMQDAPDGLPSRSKADPSEGPKPPNGFAVEQGTEPELSDSEEVADALVPPTVTMLRPVVIPVQKHTQEVTFESTPDSRISQKENHPPRMMSPDLPKTGMHRASGWIAADATVLGTSPLSFMQESADSMTASSQPALQERGGDKEAEAQEPNPESSTLRSPASAKTSEFTGHLPNLDSRRLATFPGSASTEVPQDAIHSIGDGIPEVPLDRLGLSPSNRQSSTQTKSLGAFNKGEGGILGESGRSVTEAQQTPSEPSSVAQELKSQAVDGKEAHLSTWVREIGKPGIVGSGTKLELVMPSSIEFPVELVQESSSTRGSVDEQVTQSSSHTQGKKVLPTQSTDAHRESRNHDSQAQSREGGLPGIPMSSRNSTASQPIRSEAGFIVSEKSALTPGGQKMEGWGSVATLHATDPGGGTGNMITRAGSFQTSFAEGSLAFMEQLSTKIRIQVKDGGSEMLVRLKPELLGHLQIHARTTAEGVVARILAETQAVKDYLEGNLAILQRNLKEEGLPIERIEVFLQDAWDSKYSASPHDHAQEGPARRGKAPIRRTRTAEGIATSEIAVDSSLHHLLSSGTTFHTIA